MLPQGFEHGELSVGNVDRVSFFQNLFSSTGDRNVLFTVGNGECGLSDLGCGLYEFVQNYVYNFTYGVHVATLADDFVGKFDLIENVFHQGPVRYVAAGEKLPIAAFERLNAKRIPNSGKVDRFYFRSLYFREPNGILFEIASDGPGFVADEPLETLGEKLSLPPFLEGRRKEIEAGLRPV